MCGLLCIHFRITTRKSTVCSNAIEQQQIFRPASKYTNAEPRILSNPSEPLVTVYLPTRNRRDSLKHAIESIFNQTWNSIELIVVDDASTDATAELLSRIQKKRSFRVIRNETPLGAAKSRNMAISQAGGEFITGLDDDDLWMPRRIELMIKEFRDGFSGVSSNDLMDYGKRILRWKKRKIITHQDLLYYNCAGNQIFTRTKYLQELGGFDESLSAAQDYDLWIRLTEAYGPIINAPYLLQTVNMRSERDSITTSERKMEGYQACFEKHRSKMTPKQISYQQYRLNLAAGVKPSWIELLRSVPANLILKEIKRRIFL